MSALDRARLAIEFGLEPKLGESDEAFRTRVRRHLGFSASPRIGTLAYYDYLFEMDLMPQAPMGMSSDRIKQTLALYWLRGDVAYAPWWRRVLWLCKALPMLLRVGHFPR